MSKKWAKSAKSVVSGGGGAAGGGGGGVCLAYIVNKYETDLGQSAEVLFGKTVAGITVNRNRK